MIYIALFLGIIKAEDNIVNFSPPTNKSLLKAPVTDVNCGCQCSSLTYQLNGAVQGNCMSADPNGAVWCYVDSPSSTCRDLQPSKRFPNNPWSYEACSTPPRDSPLCTSSTICRGSGCPPTQYPPIIICKHLGGCFNGPLHPPAHHPIPSNEIFTIAGAIAGAIVGAISGLGSAQQTSTHPTTTMTTASTITTVSSTTNKHTSYHYNNNCNN